MSVEYILKDVMRVGVFFDGTGSNKWNDALIDDGSISNVAKLYEIYQASGYRSLYAEGVGTQKYSQKRTFTKKQIDLIWADKKNKNSFYDIPGLAFGTGAKDIVKKKLKETLNIIKENQDKDVIIDVYGFSRGSTEARDFINEINKKFKESGDKNIINFVGIFDTVASMGLGDQNKYEFNLNLNESSAKDIVHIVSKDEKRSNFPLESLKDKINKLVESNMQEYSEMGVHTDIGGGYGELDMKKKIVVDNFYKVYYNKSQGEDKIKSLMDEAKQNGYELVHTYEQLPAVSDWALNALFVQDREFSYGLSNVYLNMMYDKIIQSGIELADISILGETKNGFSNFEKPSNVDSSYVHVSASDYWYGESITDWLANHETLSGKRKIHYNEPDKAVV